MKRLRYILICLGGCMLLGLIVVPTFQRARIYSGPGNFGILRAIASAKSAWEFGGGTNEWPTADDLFPGLAEGRTINEHFGRYARGGAIFFINRTGAPPFAYIPKLSLPYKGGEILVLSTNGLVVVRP
jgi:hypothetical protein